ncbi:peptidase [Saccharopolyspora thermophila]|uniref:Neutral zinc metallopeptidase n=1 Tax=Saccharopolyspora thermophila TaxID=89367 RepID=A0ABN1D445_9PSEU
MRVFRLVAVLVVVITCGCSAAPPEPPPVAETTVDPSFVHGTDHGDVDRLAATAVTDAQQYWAQQYPALFGTPWRDIDGGFFSVDTAGTGKAPPCAADVRDVEGNAFYCATVDAIAWDRAALLPVLREHYGDAAVVVVLAHELGHAVQARAGMDVGGAEDALRMETMADCYSGSFTRWVADGRAPHLRISAEQLDAAMRAITLFRDPVGTTTPEHGTAFDRISAFQDGFSHGPRRCANLVEAGLTASTAADPNQPLDEVLRADGVASWFGDLVTRRGGRWTPPVRSASCPGKAGPVAFCAPPPTVTADREALAGPHHDIGDQAVTTLLASRYAQAALASLGRPADARQIMCLTGAYTAAQPELSPGDLDEAVDIMLTSGDVTPTTMTGFDRIAAFRTGAVHGTTACGL